MTDTKDTPMTSTEARLIRADIAALRELMTERSTAQEKSDNRHTLRLDEQERRLTRVEAIIYGLVIVSFFNLADSPLAELLKGLLS